MKFSYAPRGVCSQRMDFDVEDGIVKSVAIYGGCHGNLQGISKLITGMPVDEVIARLKGIRCGGKASSCPDQIAQALEQAKG